MIDYTITTIQQQPELLETAANWFHQKFGVPLEAYIESMQAAIDGKQPVPQWYMAITDGQIIGGMGVIENDFHPRFDLTPNVCAVYVEKEYRCNGIAGKLLNFVSEDMAKQGIKDLYLLTSHIGFYERYGWEYFCDVIADGETEPSRTYIHRHA